MATTSQPDLSVMPDGRISGIDGMLDQISGSLAKQVVPLLRTEILPILQNDLRLQATIGAAVGREVARPLWALVAIAALYGGWKIYAQTKPRRISLATEVIPR